MYCSNCNSEVQSDTNVCPNCGNNLICGGRILNPKPQFSVDENSISVNYERASTLDSTSDVISEQFNQESGIDSGNHAQSKVVKLNYEMSEPGAESLIESGSTTSTNNADDKTEQSLVGDSTPNRKKFGCLGGLIVLIVLTAIAIVVWLKLSQDTKNVMDDNSSEKVTEQTTEVDDTTLSINNEEVRTLIIGGTDFTVEDLEYFADAGGVYVCTYHVMVNAEDFSLFLDEQEVKYQRGDADLKDVRYLGDVFRYHYNGYYLYGCYTDNGAMYLYEITDNFNLEKCDSEATAYFNELGV